MRAHEILLLAGILTGCGSSSSPPNCETAIRSAAKASGALAEPEIGPLVARCIAEKWTDVVRTCLSGATSGPAATACITGRDPSKPTDDRPKPSHGQILTGRRNEAELNLNAIEKVSLREVAENSAFVVGTSPLTPATPCCDGPGHRCPADMRNWETPIWEALDFAMARPHVFRYQYTSDGTSYEATAIGDEDCDGETVTYVLRGRLVNGEVVAEVERPTNAD